MSGLKAKKNKQKKHAKLQFSNFLLSVLNYCHLPDQAIYLSECIYISRLIVNHGLSYILKIGPSCEYNQRMWNHLYEFEMFVRHYKCEGWSKWHKNGTRNVLNR